MTGHRQFRTQTPRMCASDGAGLSDCTGMIARRIGKAPNRMIMRRAQTGKSGRKRVQLIVTPPKAPPKDARD